MEQGKDSAALHQYVQDTPVFFQVSPTTEAD